ncbi:phosphotransferase [Actinoplanes sp. NPDC026623]|uniref:phosphotransferase n=1 Tax=Actinoplanes sp. NPDC026623 TaxID=3155610 RepID=UPI0033E6E265
MTGPPLASGREADVYALDERRVLRRYRREADVTDEVAAMRHVGGLGYPVPAVYEAAGGDMIMERLDGLTMAQACARGTLSIDDGAAHLAGLLRRLHELPPWPGAAPGSRILHLDLHPENVLMTSRGPMVIDWCNARPGDPDLDTGLTALILAQVAVDERHDWSAAAEAMLASFLAAAPGEPARLLDEVVRFRDRQLSGTEPLDAAAERVLACAR